MFLEWAETFFVICNSDSGQILTLDTKKQQSAPVAKPRLLYTSLNHCLYHCNIFLYIFLFSTEHFLTNYYPPFGISCQSSQISINETSDQMQPTQLPELFWCLQEFWLCCKKRTHKAQEYSKRLLSILCLAMQFLCQNFALPRKKICFVSSLNGLPWVIRSTVKPVLSGHPQGMAK